MTGLWGEIRYAARMLLKHPAVSGLAVAALGLGIGLTALMFSIVYGAMLRGLPFENGHRILMISRVDLERDGESEAVSQADYVDWAEQQTSFDELAAYYQGTVNVRWAEEPERFDGAFVTANLFRALGVQPEVGRTFRDDEDDPGAPPTVVISHQIWMDRFGGDPGVISRVIGVNGEQAEIIGVMPEGFSFPAVEQIWVPLRRDASTQPRNAGYSVNVLGPLRPGVTRDAAMAEITGIMARIAAAYPESDQHMAPQIRPFPEQFIGREGKQLLWSMLATVSLVLLIACANVANLLLARAASRTREVGIRTAIGASRRRVVWLMVLEVLAIATVAALLAVVVAWVGVAFFRRAIAPTDPPFFMVFKVDAPILAFIMLGAIVSALIAGGIPALKASGMDVSSILKDESRGSSGMRVGRLSRMLVVGEIAMSLGLLVAAGLMTKSIATLNNYDYAFETDRLFTARLGLFEAEFPDTLDRRAFYDDLLDRLREIPSARYTALGTALPGLNSGGSSVAIEGTTYQEDRDYPFARSAVVTPGYFETVGVDVESGRDFGPEDDAESTPVAIVNRTFVVEHFPDGDALGHRFRPGRSGSDQPWLRIVGIVPDLEMQGMSDGSESERGGYYVPIDQSDARFMSILARGPSAAMSLSEDVRAAVQTVDPDTPLYFVQTLRSRIDQDTWVFSIFGSLFLVFGAVALFLAAVGLYGVMAFSVARRTPEVGIRMALGASRGEILSMVLRQGLGQVLLGLALGAGLAILVSRGLKVILFEISPYDPGVFGGIALVLGLTGLLATFIPARRATRADPAMALRYD